MTQKERPHLSVPLTNLDKGVEILSVLLLVVIWIVSLVSYADLPETIPIHYSGLGKADEFGHKGNIFVGPILASILYMGMTLLNKKPHRFNYPSTITKENAFENYTTAMRLLRVVKLTITVVFALIVLRSLQNANGATNGLGDWFLPLLLGLIFIPITYYLIKIIKLKQ